MKLVSCLASSLLLFGFGCSVEKSSSESRREAGDAQAATEGNAAEADAEATVPDAEEQTKPEAKPEITAPTVDETVPAVEGTEVAATAADDEALAEDIQEETEEIVTEEVAAQEEDVAQQDEAQDDVLVCEETVTSVRDEAEQEEGAHQGAQDGQDIHGGQLEPCKPSVEEDLTDVAAFVKAHGREGLLAEIQERVDALESAFGGLATDDERRVRFETLKTDLASLALVEDDMFIEKAEAVVHSLMMLEIDRPISHD